MSIKVESEIRLALSEQEARALYALTVYGTDKFLEFFYKHLGKSYLHTHEEGLRALFKRVSKEVPTHLKKLDEVKSLVKTAR